MKKSKNEKALKITRRNFLQTVGVTAAGISFGPNMLFGSTSSAQANINKKIIATVRGAFIYPPTELLDKEGYYSWPGSTFDAEGRQKQYMSQIKKIEKDIGMRIIMEDKPLDEGLSVTKFINKIKQSKPDGLLLILFKKRHWDRVVRIIEETQIPSVILATLGVLLASHVIGMYRKPGVYLISSQDNLDAVADGMKMIKTARLMRESLIVNITGSEVKKETIPFIGTKVRTIPHQRFCDKFKKTGVTNEVKILADTYLKNAKEMIEPSEADVIDAAKTYFVMKSIIKEEKASAFMMNCLPGLTLPHKHVPPCMAFMSLRDEGIPTGCESDLDATLTMMLQQYLFDRPAFQHNPAVETEKNHYFCAHCTSASKMDGFDGDSAPYILRSHAEAGWGCVPRVLFREGQEVTIAKYLSSKTGKKPQLLLYSGNIVGCPPIPPTGGCRTNAEIVINELDDVCTIKGHHNCMVYGNYVRQLKIFCQLYDIEVVV
jgi:hypothetical protein